MQNRRQNCGKLFITIISMLLLLYFTNSPACNASIIGNHTITDTPSYNFSKGFYNIVKYAVSSESDFIILSETKIPYLNLQYISSSDGYLEINITPKEGPVPYITLDDTWTTTGLKFIKKMVFNETAIFTLSPPLTFSDFNSSRVTGSGITLYELYNWPKLYGAINFSFTTIDEISIDFDWHPTNPRQGDELTFFTLNDFIFMNITWEITGEENSEKNNTEILKIEDVKAGEYVITVTGYDEFNHIHSITKHIIVEPSLIDEKVSDIQLFLLEYPDSSKLREKIEITAVIDYYIPKSTDIKLLIMDLESNANISIINDTLLGNGTTEYIFKHTSRKTGNLDLLFRLFYNIEDQWIEQTNAQKAFTIQISDIEKPENKIPSFPIISIVIGITFIYLVSKKGVTNKIYSEKIN
jgi:hypothetical protein